MTASSEYSAMSQPCHKLHQLFNSLPTCRFPFDSTRLPKNGISILFETGEIAHGTNRIVRVGTHTGNNQLPSRLEQHFVQKNKDRSIFRKNIGRALLNRDKDPFLAQWELDLTTHEAKEKYSAVVDHAKQKQIERKVTECIQGHFHFVAFRVDDKQKRLGWESKIISTVSLCDECGPSRQWLGLNSPKEKVRQSGLWLVNNLNKQPFTEAEYGAFEKVVQSSSTAKSTA